MRGKLQWFGYVCAWSAGNPPGFMCSRKFVRVLTVFVGSHSVYVFSPFLWVLTVCCRVTHVSLPTVKMRLGMRHKWLE